MLHIYEFPETFVIFEPANLLEVAPSVSKVITQGAHVIARSNTAVRAGNRQKLFRLVREPNRLQMLIGKRTAAASATAKV
jgi:hypothetical protein